MIINSAVRPDVKAKEVRLEAANADQKDRNLIILAKANEQRYFEGRGREPGGEG